MKSRSVRILVGLAAVLTVLAAWRLWSPYSVPRLGESMSDSTRRLWQEPYFQLGDLAVTPSFLLKTLAFFILLWLATRLVRRLVRRATSHTSLAPGVRFALERGAGYTFFFLAVVIGMQSAGLDLSALAFMGGAVGIGVGFGLQNIAKNFASGIVLLVDRPIEEGDRVDVGGLVGTVTHIGSRSTHVRTNDNVLIIVPNSEFVENRVTNWTANDPQVRISVPLGVSYESDPGEVARIMRETAAAHPDVLAEPGPDAILVGFGDSSLDFELLVWTIEQVTTPRLIRSQLYFALFKALRENGIEIPFPQRDLHVRTWSTPPDGTEPI